MHAGEHHARDDLGKSDFDEAFSGKTMVGPLTYLEKPVKPERFLHNEMKVLGLEPLDEEAPLEDGDRLRSEIASRLDHLDLKTLKQVVEALGTDDTDT